jgi:hypothetical protein
MEAGKKYLAQSMTTDQLIRESFHREDHRTEAHTIYKSSEAQ